MTNFHTRTLFSEHNEQNNFKNSNFIPEHTHLSASYFVWTDRSLFLVNFYFSQAQHVIYCISCNLLSLQKKV